MDLSGDITQIFSISVTSDSKILLSVPGELLELNSDGSMNTSFGTGGILTLSADGGPAAALSSGDVLVADNDNAMGTCTLETYSSTGSADATASLGMTVSALSTGDGYIAVAGSGGVDELDLSLDSEFENTDCINANGVAITAAGEVLVVQYGYLIELTTSGTVDTGFGSGGYAELPDGGSAVVINGSGNIYVEEPSYVAVMRFNSDGILDTSYGDGGTATVNHGSYSSVLLIDGSGEVVIAGAGYDSTYSTDGSFLARLTASGATTQRLYVEQDADYNTVSLTNSSGTVVARYVYRAYGEVTVLNADGTVSGDGSVAGSYAGFAYLRQGQRVDFVTNAYDSRNRVYIVSLGRFAQQDPQGAAGSGANVYLAEDDNTIVGSDSHGLQDRVLVPQPYGRAPQVLTGDEATNWQLEHQPAKELAAAPSEPGYGSTLAQGVVNTVNSLTNLPANVVNGTVNSIWAAAKESCWDFQPIKPKTIIPTSQWGRGWYSPQSDSDYAINQAVGGTGWALSLPFLFGGAPASTSVNVAELVAEEDNAAAQAAAFQGSGRYPGVDPWTNITLNQGDILYGGAPGNAGFFTNGAAAAACGEDSATLSQGLQIAPHNILGYRPGLMLYEVTEDTAAAQSQALANPQFGAGGSTQFYVPVQTSLKPVLGIPLIH